MRACLRRAFSFGQKQESILDTTIKMRKRFEDFKPLVICGPPCSGKVIQADSLAIVNGH